MTKINVTITPMSHGFSGRRISMIKSAETVR
jgi:hypothetical protein